MLISGGVRLINLFLSWQKVHCWFTCYHSQGQFLLLIEFSLICAC